MVGEWLSVYSNLDRFTNPIHMWIWFDMCFLKSFVIYKFQRSLAEGPLYEAPRKKIAFYNA